MTAERRLGVNELSSVRARQRALGLVDSGTTLIRDLSGKLLVTLVVTAMLHADSMAVRAVHLHLRHRRPKSLAVVDRDCG